LISRPARINKFLARATPKYFSPTHRFISFHKHQLPAATKYNLAALDAAHRRSPTPPFLRRIKNQLATALNISSLSPSLTARGRASSIQNHQLTHSSN
jgi:hypothetical protein